MDHTLYEDSLYNSDEPEIFSDKAVQWIQDSNNSNYNGQIIFDLSTLANNGKFVAWSESFIEVPLVIGVSSSANNAINSFVTGLKNGSYQLINSVQIDYNNTTLVSLTPYTNFFINYKVLSTWSNDTLQKWGTSTFVAPDDTLGFQYLETNAASARGTGVSNNGVAPEAADFSTTASGLDNSGFLKRLQLNGPVGGAYTGLAVSSTQSLNNSGFNNVVAVTANRLYQFNLLLTMRMKDVTDLFCKMPLVKGGQVRMIINYNATSTLFAYVNAGTTWNIAANASLSQTYGTSCPWMASSGAAGQPSRALGNNAAITIANNVGSLNLGGTVLRNSILSSCRFYAPCYSMHPSAQANYLAEKTKLVEYIDIFNFNIPSVAANERFNTILSNGIIAPQYVLVIPVLSTIDSVISYPEYLSPFDSCPGTSAPYGSITNFNVRIGGRPIWAQNFTYDFESFMNEVSRINALNGGVDQELTSGLISMSDWQRGYRFYVCDVSRFIAADDFLPKSVSVEGTNNNGLPMSYVTFIAYKRKIIIDLETGALIKTPQQA